MVCRIRPGGQNPQGNPANPLQVEELRIRLAQFRHQLPQYGSHAAPDAGFHLSGAAFHSPKVWAPNSDAASPTAAEVAKETLVNLEELQQMSPQAYLEWVANIPLAQSAAYSMLPHMSPALSAGARRRPTARVSKEASLTGS